MSETSSRAVAAYRRHYDLHLVIVASRIANGMVFDFLRQNLRLITAVFLQLIVILIVIDMGTNTFFLFQKNQAEYRAL